MSTITLLGIGILLLLCYKFLIYPTFVSPLSKIPNAHFSSPLSPLWILWIRKSRLENRTLLACHEKLGPIIRLGPSDISLNCLDGGIRTIYSGGFDKHDWYPRIFDNYGAPNMFSIAHSRPHSIRKRMISNLYSKSYLQSSPELDQISQTLIFTRLLPTLFNAAAAGTPVDVLPLNYATAADFITAYLFGLHNSSSFIQDLSSRAHFLDLYHSRKTYSFWYQELPKTASILHSIGLRVVPRFVDAANREIEAWCLKMCTAASAEPSASISPTSTPPVVYSQLRRALKLSSQKEPQPDPNGRRQDLAIASEMLDHLAAGQETSGITLTYLMHELSLQPALQARLRTELLTLSPPLLASGPNPSTSTTAAAALPTLPSPRAIDALPILAALVLETLRLHAAIPGPQPRVTGPVPCALAGVGGIPAGVRVAAMAHGLHRNADVFPEPDRWRPDRWLVGGERRAEMGRWFWAFGSGGRMCVGSNFALLEMKLVVAAVYSNFRTMVVDDEGIEQEDAYTAGPVGNKLVLRFERVGLGEGD